ncbi:hypothetical protein AVEN_232812-1 [Araneus ventricosus]|uniref:Uncharacterized protein n=1 Tax=Araneus ventricosus TaxID=182803 RepID=A0A4Y2GTS9_ARAVE|nr:hypothetical protein AVEN_232812-1 [Araneus ventricosus]
MKKDMLKRDWDVIGKRVVIALDSRGRRNEQQCENDLPEISNYEKRKIKDKANNVKPLKGRVKVKMVKLDSSEFGENRPKDKPILGNLKGNETRHEDQLGLLISARAETANNVCETRFVRDLIS